MKHGNKPGAAFRNKQMTSNLFFYLVVFEGEVLVNTIDTRNITKIPSIGIIGAQEGMSHYLSPSPQHNSSMYCFPYSRLVNNVVQPLNRLIGT